jgi:hypothetical protein
MFGDLVEVRMTVHKARWLANCLMAFLVVSIPAVARAQGGAAPLAPLPVAPAPAAPSITAAQLTAFAELIGEPKPVVWQRLHDDPGFVPLAAAAADARMERRSSGKALTIAGFTILGVGVVTGYVIMYSGLLSGTDCSYGNSCGPNTDRILGGLTVAILSIGVGTAIGVPGIFRMTKQSDVETQASERYQAWGTGQPLVYPGSYSQAPSMRSPGRRLDLSLLSFRF